MNRSVSASAPTARAFLAGGGEMAALIARFDWAGTSLGPLDAWPAHVRIATSLMLRSVVPIVMLWGESGVMIYNDAYSHFAGLRHPSLLGSRVREGWPEAAAFNDNVMKVGLRGDTLHYRDQELVLHRNNRAEHVWMNLDYSPLTDDAGNVVGVMAIVVETTEQVHAVRRLSGERERMGQLFEQAPSFMTLLRGPTHVYELCNPNYQRLVGHRAVIGQTVAESLPDAAAQGYVALLDRAYQRGEVLTAHGSKYAMQAEPGGPVIDRYVDFVFQPVRNAAGEVDGIFVEGVDVTDRVVAELRRERFAILSERFSEARSVADVSYVAAELLGQALGASRVGYGSIDDATDTLHVERDWSAPGVETLAGVTRLRDYGSFIDGLKRNEFIAIEDVRRDERTSSAAAALESKAARSFVNVPVLEHGRLVAVFFVNDRNPRQWGREELDFILEVGQRTRVSAERVRSDQALRASEARLREVNESLEEKVAERTRELLEMEAQYRQAQKMEAIGQLTGGIAHDFNNLLHGMSMSVEILKRQLGAGNLDAWERYVGMTQDAIRRAAALTQRLLAFSRRQTLDPKPTDIGRLVCGMEDLVQGTMGPSIQVHVDCPPETWSARVDAPQLENAILNLCINARDAMQPDGGRLAIHTANTQLDAAAAARQELPPGDYVTLAVSDSGTGMPPEIVSRVFDPFFTTKPTGQGTGLGLSMVYGFVRQSGGQVRVTSELGRGTTMTLYLRRHSGETLPLRGASEAPVQEAAQGEVVLLVEDESTIRELVREELSRSGYRVIAVGTGGDALPLLQSEQRIDLLLTDVGLPGALNGRQVADAGRARRRDLKVLFITGYADSAAFREGALPEGMEVITKPFAIPDMLQRVRAMIAG